ncbi:hypothetical protein BJ741DRAFT_589534 [Chytriomyces cf. hyalinus JEL632]|nr:hypothetical protein BJ741DRAFT_589534 [Chytriomyces cf. hyalinus JEL632]
MMKTIVIAGEKGMPTERAAPWVTSAIPAWFNDLEDDDNGTESGQEDELAEGEFVVDGILSHYFNVEENRYKYCVRWKEWGPEWDSSEPESSFQSSDLIRLYQRRNHVPSDAEIAKLNQQTPPFNSSDRKNVFLAKKPKSASSNAPATQPTKVLKLKTDERRNSLPANGITPDTATPKEGRSKEAGKETVVTELSKSGGSSVARLNGTSLSHIKRKAAIKMPVPGSASFGEKEDPQQVKKRVKVEGNAVEVARLSSNPAVSRTPSNPVVARTSSNPAVSATNRLDKQLQKEKDLDRLISRMQKEYKKSQVQFQDDSPDLKRVPPYIFFEPSWDKHLSATAELAFISGSDGPVKAHEKDEKVFVDITWKDSILLPVPLDMRIVKSEGQTNPNVTRIRFGLAKQKCRNTMLDYLVERIDL